MKPKVDVPPEELWRIRCKMREMHKRKQQRSKEFVESVQNLQPLEKAETWLKCIADEGPDYGAQEALVYLVSRGQNCAEFVRDVITAWKLDEKRCIEQCMQEVRADDFDTGKPGEVIRQGMSYAEASDVLNQSPWDLVNFWDCLDYQELSIEATMLRTVEWCNIGGFDQWWLRLAKECRKMTTQGGSDQVLDSFFIFNMCRSDYAIQLMHKTLVRMLEAIELPDHNQAYPWRRWRWTDLPQEVDHFAYAASIAFADERLRPRLGDSEVVEQALETLLEHQRIEGSWCYYADGEEPSVDTTAMAIHALALKRPRGWRLATSAARDWLWSVQDESGCWIDFGCLDSVYLTVLVLDALELAAGGSRVTFSVTMPLDSQVQIQRTPQSTSKIKALFLAANPADTPKLNLDEQIRSITGKIRASDYRDLLELVSVWAVRPDDLLQSLNEHRPHIVHFSGHGSRTGEILVVGSDGKSKPISAKAIKALFTALRDNIRVVILDACYSRSQAEVIAEVIDCVIGMEGAVGEAAATIFTASFYCAIGFGRSVQEAFDQGVTALLLEGISEENTPKLLARPGVNPSQVFLVLPTSE